MFQSVAVGGLIPCLHCDVLCVAALSSLYTSLRVNARELRVIEIIVIIIIYLLRQMAAHIKYTNQYTKNTQYTV